MRVTRRRGSPLFWTGALGLWGIGTSAFGSLGHLGRAVIEIEGEGRIQSHNV